MRSVFHIEYLYRPWQFTMQKEYSSILFNSYSLYLFYHNLSYFHISSCSKIFSLFVPQKSRSLHFLFCIVLVIVTLQNFPFPTRSGLAHYKKYSDWILRHINRLSVLCVSETSLGRRTTLSIIFDEAFFVLAANIPI